MKKQGNDQQIVYNNLDTFLLKQKNVQHLGLS